MRVIGTPTQASRRARVSINRPHCFLARSNATLIAELMRLKHTRCAVYGGVEGLSNLLGGIGTLKQGKRALAVPELADFLNYDEVVEYAATPAGAGMKPLVQAVDRYGIDTLSDRVSSVQGNEQDLDGSTILLSTAHKAKGAEFDTVRLADDFAVPVDADLGVLGATGTPSSWSQEDARLLYVAVTRAKLHLDVSDCMAGIDALARADVPISSIPDPKPGTKILRSMIAELDPTTAYSTLSREDRTLLASASCFDTLLNEPLSTDARALIHRVKAALDIVLNDKGIAGTVIPDEARAALALNPPSPVNLLRPVPPPREH